MSGTFTCASCGDTFDKGWSDEEAAAEAQENFPGIDIGNPDEASVVCDDCYRHIMGRARVEAPELIGPGWREASEARDLGITEDELAREEADLYSVPSGYLPGVGPVSGLVMRMLSEFGGFRDRVPHDSKCYRASAGFMVHVKPGCRCKR
jgi:hypothetical protein